jgi:hypothetical protein
METSPNQRIADRKEAGRVLYDSLEKARQAAVELQTMYRLESRMQERLENVEAKLAPLLMLSRYIWLNSEDAG